MATYLTSFPLQVQTPFATYRVSTAHSLWALVAADAVAGALKIAFVISIRGDSNRRRRCRRSRCKSLQPQPPVITPRAAHVAPRSRGRSRVPPCFRERPRSPILDPQSAMAGGSTSAGTSRRLLLLPLPMLLLLLLLLPSLPSLQ